MKFIIISYNFKVIINGGNVFKVQEEKVHLLAFLGPSDARISCLGVWIISDVWILGHV